ncbi:hypothetical protein HOY82DRAFT_580597 [Tuber indicum]|nr:hypothetical protein HOY82DRAFT_580597 [Tuber indicum]
MIRTILRPLPPSSPSLLSSSISPLPEDPKVLLRPSVIQTFLSFTEMTQCTTPLSSRADPGKNKPRFYRSCGNPGERIAMEDGREGD